MNILKKKIKYKIQDGVFKFVNDKNYAVNFGYQWKSLGKPK